MYGSVTRSILSHHFSWWFWGRKFLKYKVNSLLHYLRIGHLFMNLKFTTVDDVSITLYLPLSLTPTPSQRKIPYWPLSVSSSINSTQKLNSSSVGTLLDPSLERSVSIVSLVFRISSLLEPYKFLTFLPFTPDSSHSDFPVIIFYSISTPCYRVWTVESWKSPAPSF